MNWCINVLEKIYKQGIVPNYIERGADQNINGEDRDYLDFWRTLTCFFSLLVNYARTFENFANNNTLLETYLRNRGLFICDNTSLVDLIYLKENYFDEIRQRGTLQIAKEKGGSKLVDGELIRLLCKGECEEFLFSLTEPEKAGWNLRNSSPLHHGLEEHSMLTKGYEKSKDFVDLDNYPLVNAPNCSIVKDSEIMYKENLVEPDEWDILPGSWFDFSNTEDPFEGTVAIKSQITTPSPPFTIMTFFPTLDFNLTDYEFLIFHIKLVGFVSNGEIGITLFQGALSFDLIVNDGENGLDITNTTTYQEIKIPLEDFNLLITHVDKIEIRLRMLFSLFFMDNIFLQSKRNVLSINNVDPFQTAGIGTDISKAIPVSPEMDYEISFFARQVDLDSNLTFGVKGFDEDDNEINLQKITDLSDSNIFFERIQLNRDNVWYQVRGFLFNHNSSAITGEGSVPEIGYGVHLRFPKRLLPERHICKIVPTVLLDNTANAVNSGEIRIYDFKVRPLRTSYSTGFVGISNFIQTFVQNNNLNLKDEEITDNMRKFLIPYNSTLKNNFILSQNNWT